MRKGQTHATVLGVKITSKDKREVLEKVDFCLTRGKKFYITTPNPEIIVQAQDDKKLKESLEKSNISIVDGVGLKLALKVLGFDGYRITKGREMFIELLKIANERGYKVFLLGGVNRVNKRCIEKILKEFPNINIQGNSGPKLNNDAKPVSEVDSKLYKDTLRDINMSKPDFLFVAFGAPKQEKWVFDNIENLKVKGVMVVGGTLDYFSGEASLPPEWLSAIGLEWMWRLIKEPSRISRIYNAVFVFPILVLKSRLMI
ncbi:WecB/TagA/CpsF family glycosyltransferase [Candidatus Woesebacteria bacterium]|nr:WecB/TagA/CpsF family glycosyltransferase [Candidatus Woesebacteria bacterium]QQG47455.1 MAG: WecB/TagA/CpsF family glycosyltransferase [Candidatus Woesebacteria bacterium]